MVCTNCGDVVVQTNEGRPKTACSKRCYNSIYQRKKYEQNRREKISQAILDSLGVDTNSDSGNVTEHGWQDRWSWGDYLNSIGG